MVHERIPVENTLPHLNNVQIVVSQSHTVPENAAFTWLISLSIAILSDHILDRVQLTSAVIGVDDNLLAPDHLLFASIHEMVAVDGVLLPGLPILT